MKFFVNSRRRVTQNLCDEELGCGGIGRSTADNCGVTPADRYRKSVKPAGRFLD
jgi:hypothetical protein